MIRLKTHYRIYLLRDPFTWDARYVGSTGSTPTARLSRHLSAARALDSKNPKDLWIRSLLIQNSAPVMETAELVTGKQQRKKREAYWIQTLLPTGKLFNRSLIAPNSGTRKVKTTINVPLSRSLRNRLRSAAKREGRPVHAVFSDLISEYVGKPVKK